MAENRPLAFALDVLDRRSGRHLHNAAASWIATYPETAMIAPPRNIRFVVFGASLRHASLNNRLAGLASRVVERNGGGVDNARMQDFDSPFYNGDIEAESGPPSGARAFSDRLKMADGLIVASPEYNASMPAAIKNLIDWVSRIRPQPFNGKQAFLLSASPSMAGGNKGLWSLRVPLEHLGMRVYPDMFSLAQAHQAFDGQGELVDATLKERLESTITGFMDLVEAAKHYRCVKKQWIEFLGEKPDAFTDRVETSSVEPALSA